MNAVAAGGALRRVQDGALTEGIVQLLDDEGEAAVGAVHAEEDHGDVLRGAAGGPGALGGAVVRVALVERQRVVLPAGELLPLENPAVKYLREESMQGFSSGTRFFFSDDSQNM